MSGRGDDSVTDRGPPAQVGRSLEPARSEEVAALGHTVTSRLAAAALDLHAALTMIGDGPAAQRCASALDQLDYAIRQVRQLVLAMQQRSGDGQSPAGGASSRAPGHGGHGLRRRQRDDARIRSSCSDRGERGRSGFR